jgi:hypothetical protein
MQKLLEALIGEKVELTVLQPTSDPTAITGKLRYFEDKTFNVGSQTFVVNQVHMIHADLINIPSIYAVKY